MLGKANIIIHGIHGQALLPLYEGTISYHCNRRVQALIYACYAGSVGRNRGH